MNIKESLPHALGRKTLDAMIRREYGGWPPITPSSFLPAPPPRKAAAQTAGQKVNLTLQF